RLAWSWALPNTGPSEPDPLEYNGVLYICSAQNTVQALDAVTGDLIWEYKREFARPPNGLTMMRNIAIFDDKIYLNTRDAHLVAVDARTGAIVWDREVADETKRYHYTSGPLIVKGKVVAGLNGCDHYKDDVCYITATDAETGKELWRTATVARPG